MRSIPKLAIPQVLDEMHEEWLEAYIKDPTNATKRYRYRHQDIKSRLKEETSEKCVYCESKIGHNTPGDIEHKIPTAANKDTHFKWENLTIACTECNRRKRAYFDRVKPFLDPNVDIVEDHVLHHGPTVSWVQKDARAEVTIKKLELHNTSRRALIDRKVEHIDKLNNVVARLGDPDPLIRQIMIEKVSEMKSITAEYSGMTISICEQHGL